MCADFLWSGSPTITHKAKVAWEDVFSPKEEGGLGLHKFRDTAHVAWTKKYFLNDGTYWDVKEGSAGSWAWHKLLKLRQMAYDCLKYEKLRATLRHNTWVSIADVADVATIADVADENGWKIRARGHRTFHDIFEKIYAFPLPNISVGADKVLWRRDETNYQDRFHSASTLNYQRSKKNRVPWRKLVWFSQAVPRHSFMVWLALRNQLSTGDRM
ncbi:uncharacterized protein LOC108829736 [Raphanus sativus]|uniref:Uncharacterized protein LOC108829736 n=1 Tax=Raphanus sativus TaxID=3726 RepID=A0A6J0LH98_RAPSA|nr:uncharacterized protein LOC108829736 [Raphanus sativus]